MNINDLKAEIVRCGLSISQLAKKIGVSKKTLYSRLNGDTVFTRDDIKAIAQILNLNESKIMNIFFADFVS